MLLQRAVDIAAIDPSTEYYTQLAAHCSNTKDALLAAEELSDVMGASLFRNELAAIFDDNRTPARAHELLIQLPFGFVVTTNYDRLLENAYVKTHGIVQYVYTYEQSTDFASALWDGRYFILKAHSDVGSRTALVITERDYRNLIYSAPGYRATMSSVFSTRTLLFMGASLKDPEMRQLLGFLYDAFHGGGPMHYAFVPGTELTAVERKRWMKDYRVQCVPYDPSDASHPEVDEFLEDLQASI